MTKTGAPTFDTYPKKSNVKSIVNVQEFCKNRIDEILMLTEALKESPFRGQAFQRLPKHMRRRQMSHYIKRLPRRLRNPTVLSTQDDGSGLPKRPSRKFRRRPGNLLLEYNRRQKNNHWLETHIWHARRFHMTSKWCYSLPEKPTNKSFRACYRAITNHCFMSDISYYGTIELYGPENILLEGLQQCVSANCGLTFAAKMFKNGEREGFVTMYHPNSYPYGVIGEVSFLWKPTEIEKENRTIWINTHPSIYSEITDVFQTLFTLSEVEILAEAASGSAISKKISDDKEGKESVEKPDKLEFNSKGRNILFYKIPEFINKDGSVVMKQLKDKLNRFRLIGPLSLPIISNAFYAILSHSSENVSHDENVSAKAVKLNASQNPLKRDRSLISDIESPVTVKKIKLDEIGDSELNCESMSCNDWWSRFYKNDFRKRCLDNQAKFYKELAGFLSPSDLPPGMVLSLVVKDPRLTIPSKRTKCGPNTKDTDKTSLTSIDPTLCFGSLWETNVIEQVSNKIPTAEINKARAKLIVPGSDVGNLLPPDKQAKVPLIIIQRTNPSPTEPPERHGFGSGFDIIVPPGWAMPVWLSLIFRGARPGGLRETKSLTLETKNLGEYIQPDSRAGKSDNLERYEKFKAAYFKRPPSKRPNFAKIGVRSPFYFPWEALVNDWRRTKPSSQSQCDVKFYVLRNLKKLSELRELLRNTVKKKQSTNSFELDDMNCLVPITVESCGKGTPKENAMLCLPKPEDVKGFKRKKIYPTENPHSDPHLKTRKELKLEHAKLIKSLKRKRRIRKIKEAEEPNLLLSEKKDEKKSTKDADQKKMLASKDIVDTYNKQMEALWLREPQSIDTVMNSCSRSLLGYVVLGGFSFSEANGVGLGYITLHGLLSLLDKSYKEGIPPLVLFRNNTFVKYRFAKIEICVNKKY